MTALATLEVSKFPAVEYSVGVVVLSLAFSYSIAQASYPPVRATDRRSPRF